MNFFEKIGLVESVPTQPEEEPNLNFLFDVAPSAEPATVSPDAAANDIIPQIYVANYLTSQGIDGSRIVVIGNGNTKMIGDPNTEEGKTANRRTDVMFKMIEN